MYAKNSENLAKNSWIVCNICLWRPVQEFMETGDLPSL